MSKYAENIRLVNIIERPNKYIHRQIVTFGLKTYKQQGPLGLPQEGRIPAQQTKQILRNLSEWLVLLYDHIPAKNFQAQQSLFYKFIIYSILNFMSYKQKLGRGEKIQI